VNIYLDCGWYAGMTLDRYVEAGTIDNTWTAYAFEPSPVIRKAGHFNNPPIPVTFIKKAVWIKDGRVKFNISNRENASSIKGTSGQTDPKEITVGCVDFSRFVRELPDAYIICSMDIEGAEFEVLEKMLEEDTIDKINVLDIEFHHRLMADYEPKDARKLIKRIRERGVEIRLKDKLI